MSAFYICKDINSTTTTDEIKNLADESTVFQFGDLNGASVKIQARPEIPEGEWRDITEVITDVTEVFNLKVGRGCLLRAVITGAVPVNYGMYAQGPILE